MQTRNIRPLPLVGAGLAFVLLTSPAMAQTGALSEDAPAALEQPAKQSTGFDALLNRVMTAVGFSGPENEGAENTAAVEPAPKPVQDAAPVLRAVELIRPGAEQTVLQRNFFGRIVARETADLAFPVNGKLEQFPVEEGTVVEAGSLLARLDLDPFTRAVERAEIELEQAERAFERASSLAQRDIGPETAAEDTQSARDLADVALREARDALDDARIVAPYRAMIAERMTANHVIVEPGMPVVRVHDISQMRVEIDVPERLVQRLQDITAVQFSARLPGAAEASPLELIEFEAETEEVGQSYTFTLALPDGDHAAILPGGSVTVSAALPSPDPAIVLPTTAIAADAQRQPYVMVFEPSERDQGIVRAVPVDVASIDGNSFSVSDLPNDVEIVKTGAHLLRDGQEVRRFTSLRVEE